MKLKDKNIIITGASKGLGFEIAKKFVEEGANICICSRKIEALQRSLIEINSYKIFSNQIISGWACDLSDKFSVDKFYNSAKRYFKKIDVLVNNAGIHGAKGVFEKTDWDEWIDAINVNLLGSVRMCKNIIPDMKNQMYGKIIQISGGGATKPMATLSAYSTSKAGVVRFMETLAVETKGFGIDINCVAPGILPTDLLEDILEHEEQVDSEYYLKIKTAKESGKLIFKDAVDLISFLASDKSNGITGKLISANWDNWNEFPGHTDELNNSDVYTLRRIAGRDRNIGWSDN